MKKTFSIFTILCISIGSVTTVFAKDNTTNLKYVKGLGYEVDVIEEKFEPGISFFKYDSGWKPYLGGDWRHGVGSKYVWSHFDHDKKVHKTSVMGAGNKMSYSGWTDAGERASASWEKAWWGNKAWADIED